jgi:hypothetical protein
MALGKSRQVTPIWWSLSEINMNSAGEYEFFLVLLRGGSEVSDTKTIYSHSNLDVLMDKHRVFQNKILSGDIAIPDEVTSKEYLAEEADHGEDGEFAQELLQRGYMTTAIAHHITLRREAKGLSPHAESKLAEIISRAQLRLRLEYARDRRDIVSLHTARYNRQIRALINIDEQLDTESEKYIFKKTKALHLLMDTLFQKEKLLGIHQRNFRIQINNDVNLTRRDKSIISTLDLGKLSFTEQLELLDLLEKTKISAEEKMGIQEELTDEYLDPNEDIEEVEVVTEEEEPNVNKINLISSKQDDRELGPANSLMDIEQKMKQALQKRVKQELGSKGAHFDEVEKNI